MKYTPFTFADFPSYDKDIPGVIDVNGDTEALRIRVEDVEYQKGRIIRFLFPHHQEEGAAPWGTPFEPEDTAFQKRREHFPLIVHVQGSGWMEQNMFDHMYDLAPIVRQGYAVAIVQYHEAPGHTFPQQVIDAKRALRFVQDHAEEFPIDMQHLFFSGDSSGGHVMLLALLTYTSGELDDPDGTPLPALCGAVDFYGVTNLNTFDDWWSRETMAEGRNIGAVLGNACVNAEVLEASSPVHFLREGTEIPPLLMLHGSKDTVVPFTQSLEFYEGAKKLGYPVELVRVNGADHGGAIFYSAPMYQEVLRFLRKASNTDN